MLLLRVRATLGFLLLASTAVVSGCASRHTLVPRDAVAAAGAPTVTWFEPGLRQERDWLDSWRRSVGPPVVVSASSSAAAADRLIVVNWNMHVGGGDLGRLFDDVRQRWGPTTPVVFLIQEAYRAGPEVPSALDRTASFASLIKTPRADGGREEIEDAARRLGLHAYYVPSMRNGGPSTSDEDRGNAILSTLPLTDLSAIELPFERQRRVAVAATIGGSTSAGTPWHLRLVSAHLDNMVGARRLWIAGGEFGRTRQARGLVAALESERSLVLGADLNSWFGFRDGAYRTAARAFPQTQVTDRRATFHGLLRLDHLFFRLHDGRTAAFHRADDSYGSDHFPLIAQIELAPRGAPPAVAAHTR